MYNFHKIVFLLQNNINSAAINNNDGCCCYYMIVIGGADYADDNDEDEDVLVCFVFFVPNHVSLYYLFISYTWMHVCVIFYGAERHRAFPLFTKERETTGLWILTVKRCSTMETFAERESGGLMRAPGSLTAPNPRTVEPLQVQNPAPTVRTWAGQCLRI